MGPGYTRDNSVIFVFYKGGFKLKSFEEFIMEEKLDADDRKKLSDDDYGVIIKDKDGKVIERAYPMPDAKHVESAARMYPFAKRKYDADVVAELRRKIIAKAKEFNVPDSRIQSVIDDKPGGKAVKESFGPEDDDTSGTSEFDEYIVSEPDDCYTEAVTPKKDNTLKHITAPKHEFVYFGTPKKYPNGIKLDRPLFVTPYMSIASIFIWRDMELQNRIPRGSYNLNYEEWIHFNKKDTNPLSDVHVYVEGYPDLEPYTIKQSGNIYGIDVEPYKDNFYKYPWMSEGMEYLIANVDNVDIRFSVENHTVTYHISGKKTDKANLGPSKDGLISFIKSKLKEISDHVDKESKEPTGNQNCQLCVWCMEAQFRGLNVLPRPVYSPRDPVLEIPGESIIYNKTKIKLKSFIDIPSELTKAGNDCRFYCHVNWKGSEGGHEFILMRFDNKNYIIDPQDGKMWDLTKNHTYMKNTNFDNSYIVRLDGHKFNKPLLDKWNDPSTVLPWDESKDIPYMKENGMLEEYEESKAVQESANDSIHLRPATEDDLDKIYSWKLETMDPSLQNDPKTQKFIRNDAKEHLSDTQMIMDSETTIGMLEACMIDDGEWRYIGEIYLIPSYRGKGIGSDIMKKEIEQYPRIRLMVSMSNDHAIELYKSLGFKVVKTLQENNTYIMEYERDTVQESVIQNIKNKTNPFEKNLVYHISPQGTLDGQVFKPRVPEYLDKYDPSKPEFEDVENPRVCFSPSIEGALNAILVNIGRWKTADKLRDWYVYIPEKPLKEYKHRTTKQLVDEKKVYDANITKEVWIEEPVRLKQYGIIRIDSVNDKTRKKAVPATTGESKKRNYYDFKWHWLVKPKVLKDVKYDYSPLEVCKDMVDVLSDYKYGIPENGQIVSGSEHDYDTKWKLQSPEEFEKNRGGICYDYVEFEEGYLDAYGIKCKKYYMSTNLPGNDTHTFILVEDGKGGYIYPESSFKDAEGVHEVKSIEEACKIVVNGFWKINNNRKNTDSFEWHVWEYTGHPAYGSNMDTCMKYYCGWNDKTKQPKNPIYEGVAKDDDPKPKPIKEFVVNFRKSQSNNTK